jgi:hypothetical protein
LEGFHDSTTLVNACEAAPLINKVAHALVEAGGFKITNQGGTIYSVGDRFKIGEGVDGWITPAIMEVSAVGEGGSVTDVTLVDGGAFTGDAGPGTYNLDTNAAALLLKAKSASATSTVSTTAQNIHPQIQAPHGLIFATCITAFFAGLVAAVFVARRRSAAIPAETAVDAIEAISVIPAFI